MATHNAESFEVTCPCCGATLTIDPGFAKVLLSRQPLKPKTERDLDHAAQLLKQEAQRRDSLFRQSVVEEKLKPELLQRKFEEALKKTKDNPAGPPVRDLDLD